MLPKRRDVTYLWFGWDGRDFEGDPGCYELAPVPGAAELLDEFLRLERIQSKIPGVTGCRVPPPFTKCLEWLKGYPNHEGKLVAGLPAFPMVAFHWMHNGAFAAAEEPCWPIIYITTDEDVPFEEIGLAIVEDLKLVADDISRLRGEKPRIQVNPDHPIMQGQDPGAGQQ